MMRMIQAAAATAALTAALICAGWLAGSSTASAATRPQSASSAALASAPTCYDFAVSALRQHVVVHRTPPACAGLTPQEVNDAVARAIRTVVGPRPKAAGRRLAVADSRYLGSLVRAVGPDRPALAIAATGPTGSATPARLAALIAWLTAATAGARLLASRLSLRRGTGRATGVPLRVAASHAGLATAGLVLWVAFVLAGSPLLGWLDVATTWLIAGLGMATLLAEPAGSYAVAAAGPGVAAGSASVAIGAGTTADLALGRGRAPVLMIALHGAFAAATMCLVMLAVVGVG